MSERLRETYEKGRERGLIQTSYPSWRGQVIGRINKMYHTNHHNLTDTEIENYLEKSENFRETKA